MTLSSTGLYFIKSNESFRAHPYLDDAGVPTIGYGTIVYPDGTHVTMHDEPISEVKGSLYILNDTGATVNAVNIMLKGIEQTQNQFDSLIDFSYNEGTPALHGSTLLRLIKAGEKDARKIRKAFMMWNKLHVDGKLVYSAGLNNRRIRDADLYLS